MLLCLLVAGDQCVGVQGTEEDDCYSAGSDVKPRKNNRQAQSCELIDKEVV